jgi:hypothetical protein
LSCCRRTRFSASSVALALKREARIPSISLNRSVIRMQAYAVRLLRLRRIEFSVHTGKRGWSEKKNSACERSRVTTHCCLRLEIILFIASVGGLFHFQPRHRHWPRAAPWCLVPRPARRRKGDASRGGVPITSRERRWLELYQKHDAAWRAMVAKHFARRK